jgi:hypothetical protein
MAERAGFLQVVFALILPPEHLINLCNEFVTMTTFGKCTRSSRLFAAMEGNWSWTRKGWEGFPRVTIDAKKSYSHRSMGYSSSNSTSTFGGYSIMAMWLGFCFGFRFTDNFRMPYRAVSISEFWRRWHITLSSWSRDHLYISLESAWKDQAICEPAVPMALKQRNMLTACCTAISELRDLGLKEPTALR